MWRSLLIAILICEINCEVGYLQQVSQRQVAVPDDDGQYHEDHDGWDIRLSVPGEPGRDYPTLGSIPKTSFSCAGKEAGYYADLETECQVFRVCTTGATFGFQSFLCPNGTIFNQQVFVCDWWMNVNCQGSLKYYNNNNNKFENLRMGPQFMSNIKQMLMHPMKNPPSSFTNNLVTQVYVPPPGQRVSGALTDARSPSNVYVPAQQLRTPLEPTNGRIVQNFVAATTISPRYVPPQNSPQRVLNNQFGNQQHYAINSNNADYTNGINTNGIIQTNGFKKQNQFINNGQFNGYNNRQTSGQYRELNRVNNLSQPARYTNEISQNQVQNNNGYVIPRPFQNNLSGKLTDGRNVGYPYQNDGNKQLQYSYTKHETYPSQYNIQNTLVPTSSLITQQQKNILEAKQNLVSPPVQSAKQVLPNPSYLPAKVIAKTITINKNIIPARLVNGKPPLSRVTVKSWVVQPSKSANLIAEPSPPSRKYLTPPPPVPFVQKAAQLKAPSTPAPKYLSPLIKKPLNNSITITKHSHINTNHNNLTFTDILTKEKLDITVDKIVKDTSNLLGSSNSIEGEPEKIVSSSPRVINTQVHSNSFGSVSNNNIHTSNRINDNTKNYNRVSFDNSAPHFRQKVTQQVTKTTKEDIEDSLIRNNQRTVTLRITVPIQTASYLFKTKSESEFDKLEILNTGSSNYLVLTNKQNAYVNQYKFIPLGKLVTNNSSNSQAFVQELIQSTLNAAKSYENNVNENFNQLNLISSINGFGQEFETINNEDINDIEQKVSQISDTQQNNYETNQQQFNTQYNIGTQNDLRGSTKFSDTVSQNKIEEVTRVENVETISSLGGNYYTTDNLEGNNESAKLRLQPTPQQQVLYNKPELETINNEHDTQTELVSVNHQHSELDDLQKHVNPNVIHSVPTISTQLPERDIEFLEPHNNQIASPPSHVAAKLQEAPSTLPTSLNNFNQFINTPLTSTVNEPSKSIVNYKADKTYYVYSNNGNSGNGVTGNLIRENTALTDTNQNKEIVTTVQFIPSIGFQLDNERDQDSLLKAIHRGVVNEEQVVRTDEGYVTSERVVNNNNNNGYQINQVQSNVQVDGYPRITPATIYQGPSSYLAPQRSVGRLESPSPVYSQQRATPNPTYIPPKQRLEELDNGGYPKSSPAVAFRY